MSCTAPALPLAANHICPKCKRPIHVICVGKHLEDAPLGRDIICMDCAKASSQWEKLEDESRQENEVTPSTPTTLIKLPICSCVRRANIAITKKSMDINVSVPGMKSLSLLLNFFR
jgi:hypothetical protein